MPQAAVPKAVVAERGAVMVAAWVAVATKGEEAMAVGESEEALEEVVMVGMAATVVAAGVVEETVASAVRLVGAEAPAASRLVLWVGRMAGAAKEAVAALEAATATAEVAMARAAAAEGVAADEVAS